MTTSFRIFGPGEKPPRGGLGYASPEGAIRSRQPDAPSSQEIAELRLRLSEAEQKLDELAAEALAIATIVEIRSDAKRMLVSLGPGGVVDIGAIDGARIGARVRLNRNTLQPFDVIDDMLGDAHADANPPAGMVVSVVRVGVGYIEADVMNTLRCFKCDLSDVQKDERVVIDPSQTFVIGSLGMPPPRFAKPPGFAVEWSAIGGHDAAKAALREALELPFAHAGLFAAYAKRPVRGVLLEGPPGTGKTLLAKAAATSIARVHGKATADAGAFVYVKGPELLNMYIGKTEEAIRQIFESARLHYREHGYPAVVFLDECDALLGRRDQRMNSSIGSTVIPQFLAEMDGIDAHATMIILATNRADMLDPAVIRDGRIDRHVYCGRPDRQAAIEIAKIHLAGRPLAPGIESGSGSIDAAAVHVIDTIFGVDALAASIAGAMIAGFIERASTLAITRDIAAGSTAPSGITYADLSEAVTSAIAALVRGEHVILETASPNVKGP